MIFCCVWASTGTYYLIVCVAAFYFDANLLYLLWQSCKVKRCFLHRCNEVDRRAVQSCGENVSLYVSCHPCRSMRFHRARRVAVRLDARRRSCGEQNAGGRRVRASSFEAASSVPLASSDDGDSRLCADHAAALDDGDRVRLGWRRLLDDRRRGGGGWLHDRRRRRRRAATGCTCIAGDDRCRRGRWGGGRGRWGRHLRLRGDLGRELDDGGHDEGNEKGRLSQEGRTHGSVRSKQSEASDPRRRVGQSNSRRRCDRSIIP